MAGSNQAQNLQGLLSGLTGAFNQQDMGQGMMFAQNLRDYNAPVLDANDPNSLLDRQRWAQRNGYQKEAVAMGSTLGNLNAENQLKEESAEKATRMANMFGNIIPNMPEERQDEARSVRDALANGEMTYKEALDWLNTGVIGSNKLHSGKWYKDGSYMGVDTYGNLMITTPDGSELSAGDPGYEDRVKAATNSGVIYERDSAEAAAIGQGEGEQVVAMGNTGVTMYESALDEVERLTYAISDNMEIIDMLQSGDEINTGALMGRVEQIFGGEAVGKFENLQGNAAIDFLMNFKGPTTDFEFTKSEAAAFGDLLRNEDINIGKMKQIQKALKRELSRQKRLAWGGYKKMEQGLDDSAFQAEIDAYPVPSWMSEYGVSATDPESTETKDSGADLGTTENSPPAPSAGVIDLRTNN